MNDSSGFQDVVWEFYRRNARNHLPWRRPEANGSFDVYKILVSEIMLQQTQVSRVVPKYEQFLREFPDIYHLADGSLGDVLRVWNGLGYNRRAKYLWQAAQVVVDTYKGVVPDDMTQLVNLPGVGKNTAGAVLAYAYNIPGIFIETNIRTAYIHHFFPDAHEVSDKKLEPIIARTVPVGRAREWYWALMDYGSYLKTAVGNISRQSKHFTKQPAFDGSRRQLRGQILRSLTEASCTKAQLTKRIDDVRLESVLDDLIAEGLILYHKGRFRLA